MFNVHGNVILEGDWPEDLASALRMTFVSADFKKLFGDDPVVGRFDGQRVYVVNCKCLLALSDLFESIDLFVERCKVSHERSCELFLQGLAEANRKIGFHLQEQDIVISESHDYDLNITSDGESFVFEHQLGHTYGEGNFEGYVLTGLARTALRVLFDSDFDILDARMRAMLRCLLYLDVIPDDFFRTARAVLHGLRPNEFDRRLHGLFLSFIDTSGVEISDALAGILMSA